MHYFAYGNLLDIDIMRRLCPSVRAVGVACLRDHQIAFAKCADPSQAGCTLEEKPGAETWGVQYELSDEDMKKLDDAAGVGQNHWTHKSITVAGQDGKSMASVTYVIPQASGAYSPPETYVAPIFKGAEAFSLPAPYRAALKDIITRAQAG